MKKLSLFVAIAILSLGSCKQDSNSEMHQEPLKHFDSAVSGTKIKSDKIILKNFTYNEIAKYAIASIMFQKPNIIKVVQKKDIYYVSYVRKSDSQKFDYLVKFKGNKIMWAGGIGERWRDSEYDEKISFRENNNKISIIQTYSDGSESKDDYNKSN